MADPETDLEDTIANAAARPKSATGDNGSLTEHSLPELIQADEHLANKNAGRGFSLSNIKPGGPI